MDTRATEVDLCVVVVNYCTPAMVIDCLETVVHQVRAVSGKVALVDNASPDDSVARLRRWIREARMGDVVELIESADNGGFAAGNNIGIRSVDAAFYLLLNSDTLVREGALEELLAAMASERDVGLVGPRLEWPDGEAQESCFRYHRPLSELVGSAGTGAIHRLLARYEVPMRVSDQRSFPEWTSFACVMIRGEVFRDVGFLDDGFFMYFEDVELCLRAAQAGWRVMHDPDARVVHLRGGSSPVKSLARRRNRLPRYFHESRTRYFYKAYGAVGLLSANLCWTLGWLISSTRSLLQRNYLSPNCRGQWRDVWINFWNPMAVYTHPGARES